MQLHAGGIADQLGPRIQLDSHGQASERVFDGKQDKELMSEREQLEEARQLHRFDHLHMAKTFQEYLDKYYGTVERRDMMAKSDSEEDEVLSQHSDSAVDYTPDAAAPFR